MREPMRFLIIDGYPRDARDALQQAGMGLAWELFQNLLRRYVPDARTHILLPSDPGIAAPTSDELASYDGIIWTGCNLSIGDSENPSVISQLETARRHFEIGIPSYGSCWGLQVGAVAAGGQVRPNPKGREMGFARKTHLTEEGRQHAMMAGKPFVYEPFSSHEDEVTCMPPDSTVLSTSAFTRVQAAEIRHRGGVLWGVQYHCEYNLHEMARLIVARAQRLVGMGFYRNEAELQSHVDKMEALHADPSRKDLRWQLAIDDEILDDSIRESEFANWLTHLVAPQARAGRGPQVD